MKNLVTAAAILYCASAFAAFGTLEKEWTKDNNKYCKYTNGVIITIKIHELCPVTNG